MSNWNDECKKLNSGLIGLAVTKGLSRKTRTKITNSGDAALRFLVDPFGETDRPASGDSKNRRGRDERKHIRRK